MRRKSGTQGSDSGRQDWRGLVETLLLMGGVEPNPGPPVDGRPHGILTPEKETWIFSAAKWSAKGAMFHDRMKALLAYFQPSTVIYQRIVALADTADGEGNTQDAKWDLLVEKVKTIVPKTVLTEQDRLRQMKKRKDESWSEFLDWYSVYAHTCAQVEDRQKIAELY